MDNKELAFGLRDKIGYFLGSMGNDFTFQLASGYLMLFYTKGLGLEAGLIGTLMLLTKVIDAVTDLGMGYLSDHLKPSKKGRYRPWIKRMSLPVAVSSILMYNAWIINWPTSYKVLYLFLSYLLWSSVFYTSINIPYSAMTSVMTNDAGHRAMLSTYRTMGSVVAGTFIGFVTPFIIFVQKGESPVLSPNRFMLWAVVLSLCAFIAYQWCFHLCKERALSLTPAVKRTLSDKESPLIISLLKDKGFMSLMLVSILCTLAMMTSQMLNQYVFLDYFENTHSLAVMSLLMTLAMLLVSTITQKLTRRYGKKRVSMAGILLSGFAYGIAFILGRHMWLYMALSLMAYGGLAYFSLTNWAFVADVIDDFQVRKALRPEGRFYAIYSFSRKLAQALASGLGGGILTLIQYDSLAIHQSLVVKEHVFKMGTLLPAMILLLAGLILGRVYPLNQKRVEANQKRLQNHA